VKDRQLRRFVFALMAMMLAMLAFARPAFADIAPAGAPRHLAMTLVAESDTPAPGSQVTLAIDTRPEAGWHGYWDNPGDAGFPAKLDWTLPRGVSASPPRYPMPGTLLVAGLMNYVFKAPYAPLVTLTIPQGMKPGAALPIAVHLSYLVCTDAMCVPEDADLKLNLTIGDGAITPDRRAQFDAWRKAIPKPLGAPARYQIGGGDIRLAIPYPASAPLADVYFFPETTGAIDFAAPQSITRDGDTLIVASKSRAFAQPIDGVLRIAPDQGLAVHAIPGSVPPPTASTGGGAQDGGEGWVQTALLSFLGAVLGGLILNIMPCVFPILSLKALSLARSGETARAARHEALAYSAGVILVCVALGGAMLGLRAGGSAIGWAFQLQNPATIALLLMLSVAIALNLAGLFEVPMPAFAGQAGGAGGAFATGALAAFIATPCTGPFMGAALGAALVLPWFAALAVFAGLGIGLALPFLAIGFLPALRKRLPRPGAWMETFRHILSVPMWLTAIALLWVLGRQTGVDGMTRALLAVLGAGIIFWVAGRRQRRGLGFGWVAGVLLLAIALSVPVLVSHLKVSVVVTRSSDGEMPFSEARLDALRTQQRPVFAYFTADWCLACKVNEHGAIETSGVRAAFARHNVAVLVGDWTSGDPVLGRFIEAHNRVGVPLYLYYAPGAAEPQVLPQVLTPGMLEALAG
jgi:DsbC/DsbD-like thiol-disulfide interchange protein/cytochrome c biogenesis protein CcdA